MACVYRQTRNLVNQDNVSWSSELMLFLCNRDICPHVLLSCVGTILSGSINEVYPCQNVRRNIVGSGWCLSRYHLRFFLKCNNVIATLCNLQHKCFNDGMCHVYLFLYYILLYIFPQHRNIYPECIYIIIYIYI